MKLHYLYSSCVLIEDKNVKILCDPWLASSSHYGSWSIYPPYDFNPKNFDDIDYIYISHIHQDHIHRSTLELLNKDVPVLIQTVSLIIPYFDNSNHSCNSSISSWTCFSSKRIRQ